MCLLIKILFLLFISFSVCSNSIIVDSIFIEGNILTKNEVIKREIRHPLYVSLDSTIMVQDQNRIYNLGIFSKVDILLENNIYTVRLIESPTLIVLPIIDFDEEREGWLFGGSITNNNFRGFNQKLFLGFMIGEETVYWLSFQDPWLFGDHISFGSIIYNRYMDNLVYDYRINEKKIALNTGFYLGLNNKFKFTIGYNHKSILDNLDIDQKNYIYNFIQFDYKYDTRDIFIDPTSGQEFNFKLKYNNGISQEDYQKISFSYQKYYSLLKNHWTQPVFSHKLIYIMTFPKYDDLPFIAYEYLGGEQFVRGYSAIPVNNHHSVQEMMESSNILFHSMEVQGTLVEKTEYYSIELGLDWAIFLDVGLSCNNHYDFIWDDYLVGYGLGARFFLLNTEIAIDIGFNPYKEYQIHFYQNQ